MEQDLKLKLLYEKYSSFLINQAQMSTEIGISYSNSSKILSKFSENQILKNNMLPKWKKVSKKRLWNIREVVEWIDMEN